MNIKLPYVIKFVLFLILTFLLVYVYWANRMLRSGVNPLPGGAEVMLYVISVLTPFWTFLLYLVLIFALFYRGNFFRHRPKKDSTILDD